MFRLDRFKLYLDQFVKFKTYIKLYLKGKFKEYVIKYFKEILTCIFSTKAKSLY